MSKKIKNKFSAILRKGIIPVFLFGFIISFILALNLSFVSPPTPSNNTYQIANSTEINLSVSEENLSSFIFNWNGTNTSYFDSNLVFMMNFENISALGDNSTNVIDIAGGRNATWENSTTGVINYTTGKYGKGVKFDGVDDYLQTPSLPGPGSVFTIETWSYPNAVDGYLTWHLGSYGYIYYVNTGAQVQVYFAGNCNFYANAAVSVALNTWHHIVGVYENESGNGKMKVYYDGELLYTNEKNCTVGTTADNLDIGARSDSLSTRKFNGTIDEIRIYNKALTGPSTNCTAEPNNDICNHYISNLQKYNTTQYYFYRNITNLADSSYSYYGWTNNTASQTTSTGKNYLYIGDFINITYPSNGGSEASDFVVNATFSNGTGCLDSINVSLYNSVSSIVDSGTNASGNSSITFTNNPDDTYTINATAYCGSDPKQSESITITVDGSNPNLNFTNPTQSNNSIINKTSTEINISIVESNLDNFVFNWNGTNRTMPASYAWNISYHGESGAIDTENAVLIMTFNNISAAGENYNNSAGITIRDYSSAGNNGTMNTSYINPTWNWTSNGKYGGAFEFIPQGFGTQLWGGSYIKVPNSDSLDFPSGFALEAWAKLNSSTGNATISRIIYRYPAGTDGYLLEQKNGLWSFSVYVDGDLNMTNSSAPPTGEWQHLVGVRESDGNLKLYVDGVLQPNTTSISGTIDNSDNLFIAIDNNFAFPFHGFIDEVRIYNTSLTGPTTNCTAEPDNQVCSHYFSNLQKYNTTQYYFHFNMTGLNDGNYTYYGLANDTLGKSNNTETRILTVNQVPSVTINSQTGINLVNSTLLINGTSSDVSLNSTNITIYNSSFGYVASVLNVSGNWTWNYTFPKDDAYYINATAFDDLNNSYTAKMQINISTDCYCDSCSDCEFLVKNNTCSTIYLNKSLWNHQKSCIKSPENFNNKILDCQGYTINGSGAGYGIYLYGRSNATVKNCKITNFAKGIFISGEGKWTQLTNMSQILSQHGLESLNGTLYVAGGVSSSISDEVTSFYAYNISNDSWEQKADVPVRLQSMVLRAVNSKLYYIGGHDSNGTGKLNITYEYDPTTNNWTRKVDMLRELEDMGSGVVNDKIYIFGGIKNSGHKIVKEVQVYDTSGNNYTRKSNLPDYKLLGDFGVTYNNNIYLVGATNTMLNYPVLNPDNSVYMYDTSNDNFTRKADIPNSREYKEAEILDGKIYTVSGATTHTSTDSNKTDVYDIDEDFWIEHINYPYVAQGVSMTKWENKIYASGGNVAGDHDLAYFYRLDMNETNSMLNITNNTLINNTYGIYIENSNNNSIGNNNISSNGYGIYINSESSLNKINSNFIDSNSWVLYSESDNFSFMPINFSNKLFTINSGNFRSLIIIVNSTNVSINMNGSSGNSVNFTVSGFDASKSYNVTKNNASYSNFTKNGGNITIWGTFSSWQNFTISQLADTSSSETSSSDTSGSSGSNGDAIVNYFWKNTYLADDGSLEKGYTKMLKEKERIKIIIKNEVHYVGIIKLTETTAVINISSTPQQVTMSVGEEKKFEFNGDGFYDLSIILNSVNSNDTNITLFRIEERIPEEEKESASKGEKARETPKKAGFKDSLLMAGYALMIILFVYVIYLISMHVKKIRENRFNHRVKVLKNRMDKSKILIIKGKGKKRKSNSKKS